VQAHHLDARRAHRRRAHLRAAHRHELERVGGLGAPAARGDRGADGVHELFVTDAHRAVHALQQDVAAAVHVREIRRARVRGDRGRQLQDKRAPRLAGRRHFHTVDELFQPLHLRRVRVFRVLDRTRERIAFRHPARNGTRGSREAHASASRCGEPRARKRVEKTAPKQWRTRNGRWRFDERAAKRLAKSAGKRGALHSPRALTHRGRRAHRDITPRARLC
jgi:hypothetical protein